MPDTGRSITEVMRISSYELINQTKGKAMRSQRLFVGNGAKRQDGEESVQSVACYVVQECVHKTILTCCIEYAC